MWSKGSVHISFIIQARQNGLILLMALGMMACKQRQYPYANLFSILKEDYTGLHFSNKLNPDPAFNLFSYMYYYNGAGIGAGDFNKDGFTDLFFASNTGSNKLYLNKGAMKFIDATVEAGISSDSSWSTGVSVVDINADGLLDIYICQVGNYKVLRGRNRLLVCQTVDEMGVPHFKDMAVEYGLDFSGYGTQAVFFDQDLDGDLDMFLLNHSVNHDGNYAPRVNFENTYDTLAGQRFYRNEMQPDSNGYLTGKFIDVTKVTGIRGTKIGYGLGVAVADVNLDGWPDIYVGNDFHENDYLYINNKNGTFSEECNSRIKHTSQFSMGVDMADVNNDALPEIVSMDMMPYDPYMLKRSLTEDDYAIYTQKLSFGYNHQYARNNLQLNRGDGYFSEVGQFSGVYATDWSWAALWMDFNNDGSKDLFVSNGIPKRMNDIDYINFVSGGDLQQKLKDKGIQQKDLELISRFPEIKLPNQFFLNKGGMQFSNLTDSIKRNPSTFSNGAVYADLDNDGDLDIVVNNINDPVFIYQNNTVSSSLQQGYASIELRGPAKNPNAIGAKVYVFGNSQVQSFEQQPVHGFLSSMLAPIHIGLNGFKVDSVIVVWPDQTFEKVGLQEGRLNSFSYTNGLPVFPFQSLKRFSITKGEPDWENRAELSGIAYRHIENPFNEFDREPLIPHMVSEEGPALAIADINHDGLEDVFAGGSKGNAGVVYLQNKNGTFTKTLQPAIQLDSMWEHVDATWVDVNRDTHLDLVIATGGNEYYGQDDHLKPLVYLNDGKGLLNSKKDAFGEVYATQSKVQVIELNGDGNPDLFIAGRAVPWEYGSKARSYLLLNDGKGRFRDVTAQYCSDLIAPGMVTDAVVVDINGDQKQDLLLTMEWGGIDAYLRSGHRFLKKTITDKKGWWQFILPADLDNDGDMDYLAGNFGLNSRLKADSKHPVSLYLNDFDDNGRKEQLMTYFLRGKEIPFAGKLQLEKSIPVLKKKFLYAEDFAKIELKALFGQEKLNQATRLQADCFSSMMFLNKGGMHFEEKVLPEILQYSTLRTAILLKTTDMGMDGVMLAGNFYPNHVELGRQDADGGSLLQVDRNGRAVARSMKGLSLDGQVRKIKPIRVGNIPSLLIANNNGNLILTNPVNKKNGQIQGN